jgi:hypothetical protein
MSFETSPEDAAATVGLPAGVRPADLIAELVAALPERDGDDYLDYERDGEWTLASGSGPRSSSTATSFGSWRATSSSNARGRAIPVP